ILSGYFNSAAPAIGPEEVSAVRIGNLGPINFDRIVMKTFVEWPGLANPCTVLALDEFGAVSKSHSDSFRLWRHDAKLDAPLRIDLRILAPRLARRSSMKIVGDSVRRAARRGTA